MSYTLSDDAHDTNMQACTFSHPCKSRRSTKMNSFKSPWTSMSLQKHIRVSSAESTHSCCFRCQRSRTVDHRCHKDVKIMRDVMVCLSSFFTFYLQPALHKWAAILATRTWCIWNLLEVNKFAYPHAFQWCIWFGLCSFALDWSDLREQMQYFLQSGGFEPFPFGAGCWNINTSSKENLKRTGRWVSVCKLLLGLFWDYYPVCSLYC